MAEPRTLTEWLAEGRPTVGDHVALRTGATELTLAELLSAALRVAGTLAAAPAGPPARVGVLAGNDATSYIGVLAAMYVGAAAVPLNRSFPAVRTRAAIEAAGLTVVVTDDLGSRALAGLGTDASRLRLALTGAGQVAPGTPDPLPAGEPLDEPVPVAADDVAYIMFTSGSTGRPKGVPITHANALHFLRSARERYRLDPGDVVTQTFEPTFDLFMFAPFMAWAAGAQVLSVPKSALLRLPEFLARHRATVWFSVPSTIRLVRRFGGLAAGGLPSLRYSLFCGEALRRDDAEAWWTAAPGAPVDNLYGPTELTIACSCHRWQPGEAGVDGLLPIGELHDGLSYLLVDDRQRPAGDEGELCVAGPQMFSGYLDPADDAGRFVESGGVRWYRTGDRARRLDGGGLACLGRLDSQVKIRGYRVELQEVEHELRRLDEVDDGTVVTIDHDGEPVLAAVFTGGVLDADALPRLLSARLPEYMVPRHVRRMDALPLNANGKVDRRRIADLASAWFGRQS